MNHNVPRINKLSTAKDIEHYDSVSKIQELKTTIISVLQVNKEYQSLVSPLTTEEYDKLKDDIQEHGLDEPIKVNSQMVILDGHHRYKACQEIGISPKFEVKSFENQLLEKRYVIAANRYRRHLNTFQRVELELKLELIDKEIARHNVIANLPTITTNINSQNSVNRLGRQGVNQSTARRAKTSHETVRQVKVILEKAPEELKEKLRTDKIKINKAYNTIKREETRQQLRDEAANTPFPATNGIQLIHGDFIEKSKEIPDSSVDLIFTDPPYAVEYLWLYGELAKVAERLLKPCRCLCFHRIWKE
jgi:ParB-like chromosome segregation protein Spo0J